MTGDIERTQLNPLELMQQAISKGVDVETMRGLMDLQRDWMKMEAETAYNAAMARLQETIPQINKYGQGKNSKFARLDDIDTIIRPLLAEFGFSFSFDEEAHTDKTMTFLAKLAHSAGHSEVKRLTVPIDAAASNREGKSIRPAIQDAGSTVSYARRYLIGMHLNLVTKDADTDGEDLKPITAEEALDLESMIEEVKADKARFLQYMGVATVLDILARDHRKAIAALEAKKRATK